MKINVYLATHFFSESGYEWTMKLANRIREEITDINLYNPVENGEINDKSAEHAAEVADIDIAVGDNKYLKDCNVLIASLDGVEIDSGVSAEIGYFSGLIEMEQKFSPNPKKRIIIGLYTDIRKDGDGDNRFYINLYTKGLVNLNGKVVNSTEELINELKKLQRVLQHEAHFNGGI